MGSKNISKEDLYLGVKTIIDSKAPHIHLYQHKLFTLFSLGFQYFLYQSTKEAGHYIIRIEDGPLAEKLSYKAKDESTKKFIQGLLIPRKLKFGKSTFYLDYFHVGSWSLVQDLPKQQIKGALIVKNSVTNPLKEIIDPWTVDERVNPNAATVETAQATPFGAFPSDYYYTSLQEFIPKTIAIGPVASFPNADKVTIPFIKENDSPTLDGVMISKELKLKGLLED